MLTNTSLDLAVAQGAAYYGVVRRGGGIRIGGGTARSFYVGLETAAATKPWLCVVPRDAQEGEEITIAGHDFDLLMGQPVVFPAGQQLGPARRQAGRPGDGRPRLDPRAASASEPDARRPQGEGRTRAGQPGGAGDRGRHDRALVPVADRRPPLAAADPASRPGRPARRRRIGDRRGIRPGRDRAVRARRGHRGDPAGVRWRPPSARRPRRRHGPARLVKRLEEVLDVPRDQWPPSALRACWEPLLRPGRAAAKSPQHESRWFNLAGFFLRPGRGFPLDEIRIKALWPVFHQGVKHTKDVQCWAEWWILWRRVAAGLSRPHHDEIYRRLAPFLLPAKGTSPSKKAGRPKPEPHELAEMWRVRRRLEQLTPAIKESLGDVLLKEIAHARLRLRLLWCLGRLGARVPLYGPANTVVRKESPSAGRRHCSSRSFAPGRETGRRDLRLGQLARVAGDRARDLDESNFGQQVLARLTELGADETALRPVREYHELETAQQAQALGDSLPIGLRLLSEGTA